jgi:hypothetical protein
VLEGGRINLSFRSRLRDSEILEQEELEKYLSTVQLSKEEDTVCWALIKNG